MSKKVKKVKRKALRKQISDEHARREAAEAERDVERREAARLVIETARTVSAAHEQAEALRAALQEADHTIATQTHALSVASEESFVAIGRAQLSDAVVRNILRAAGGGQATKACNPTRVRALCREFLDAR